jgi:phage I-like protein
MTSLWTVENSEHLKQLREQAGLDAMRFAIENAISLAQLQQLENGGDSCFYSQAIKAHLGHKLLTKLQARMR